VGGEAKDPRERKGRDRCVVLLGRSHQGRPEAEDTLTMNSHGVEISIAGGGADEKDDILSVAHWAFITGELFFGGSPGLLLQVKFHDG